MIPYQRLALLGLVALCAQTACVSSDGIREYTQSVSGVGPGGSDLQYLVGVPDAVARPETGWPLLVFLHGRGEIGGDLARVKIHGPFKAAAGIPGFAFLVAAPHWQVNERWRAQSVLAVIDDVRSNWPIDDARIYLTGLSLGAHGTWDTIARRPEMFAAAAPISGYGNPDYACRLASLPIWSFHGVNDDVVAMDRNQEMVDAVRACGGTPGLNLYPDTGHDAWSRTYADPLLYDWLLSHARQDTKNK